MSSRPRSINLWERLIDCNSELLPYKCLDVIDLNKARAIHDYILQTAEEKKKFSKYIDAVRLQKEFLYSQNEFKGIDGYRGAKFVGRRYCRSIGGNSTTIQTMTREIRYTLYGDLYIEVDFANMLPSLLYHYFGHLGLPYLERYINNREEVLSSLEGVPPDVMKKAIIVALGCGRTVTREMTQYRDQLLGSAMLNRLRFDHNEILNEMKKLYPDFIASYQQSKGNLNGVIFLWANDVEACLMDTIISHLRSKNITSLPLVHDAVYISREFYEANGDNTIVQELQDLINSKYGIELNLKATTEFPDIIDFEERGIDITTIDGGQFYASWKEDFETDHYLVTNPLLYVWVSPDGESQYFPQSKFINEVCAEENKEFVKDWVADSSKRKYIKEVFHPPPVSTSEAYKNLYTCLAAEKIDPVPEEDVMNLTYRVRHQLYILSGGTKECYDYLLNYLAMRVQQPGWLPKVSLAFRSIQGTGKDSFFAFIGEKILGSQYYIQAPQASDLFSDKHSKNIIHKLMVVVSEVSRNDVKSVINQVKSFITAPVVSYRPLYCPTMKSDNFASVILFGQDQQFLSLEADDRRFAIFTTLAQYANKEDHFKPLHRDYNNPKVARAFYQYLIARDVGEFNACAERPMTTERRSMMLFSIKPFRLFLVKRLDELYEQFNNDSDDFTTLKTFYIPRRDLRQQFLDWTQESGVFPDRRDDGIQKIFFSDLNALITETAYFDDSSRGYIYPVEIKKVRGVVMVKFMYEELKTKLSKDYPENESYEISTCWDDVKLY